MTIHPRRYLRALVISTGIAALWFAGAMAAYGDPLQDMAAEPEGPIVGQQITVIDGDTLIVSGTRIRLHGVDAPEIEQQCADAKGDFWRCGQRAREFLQDALVGSTVVCERAGKSYDRVVARCQYGAGVDIGRYLVINGFAVDVPKYSKGEYRMAEQEAAGARRGIWTGAFIEPADFRRGARLPRT